MAVPIDLQTLTFILFLIAAIIGGIKSLVIVRPYERGIVEFFGRYNRTVGAGLNFIIPFAETCYRVDMREAIIEVPAQEVITKDNVALSVDAVIYFKVMDPFRVMYNVAMFEDAISKLAQTNLRNIIGDMILDATLASRDKINMELRKTLDEITDRWGVRVTRVEIQDIRPPQDIVEAMSRQMKAERTKRAAILEAEAVKQSDILKAEGKKSADILAAQGQAQAIETVAQAEGKRMVLLGEGEASAIQKVFGAMHDGKPTKDILMLKYLEALGKMADGRATKIFMPMETSGLLGGVAAIGEMLRGQKEDDSPLEAAALSSAGKPQRLKEEETTIFQQLTGRKEPQKKDKEKTNED